MALQSSGAISLSDIRHEFGVTGAISMSDLYRGGSIIRNNFGNNSQIPASSLISLSDFYNTYREGTTLQKLETFRNHRHSGMIWANSEVPDTGYMMSSDEEGFNNPNGYGWTDTTINASERSGQKAVSEWTTLFGVAAMPGGYLLDNPITCTNGSLNQVYNSITNGNASCTADQVNLTHNEIGNVSYTYSRQATNKWAEGLCIIMPGKWSFERTTTASSVTLASGEIILWGRERGGDGWSQTKYVSSASDTTCTQKYGFWYNTGSVGISTNGNASSQTFTLAGEHPDQAWIFSESA